jgi:hypothetical protein
VIAHDLAHEINPRKAIALSEELNQAIAQQRHRLFSDKSPSQEIDPDLMKRTA